MFEIQKYVDSYKAQKIRGGTEQSEQTNQGDKERTLGRVQQGHGERYVRNSEENMEYASRRKKPQFVWNDFCEEYVPTDRKHTYYPSVITNDRLYEIKISDIPVIPYFPVNSYYEWTNYRYYGLRNSTAYILVFDLSNIETFQYIKTIREQICESRNMTNVPILVVGNKQDLVTTEEGHSSGKLAINSGIEEKRRDIMNLVKKHWKSGYIECSAKYNWKVVAVFKELINMIDHLDSRDQSPMLDNIQDALDRNKCIIL
ncbi:hypothetical protein HHI36_021886 [Cryptolaemus montrouzieri]|uniref:Uncharacterized protein n=1 Tax=Cryptolaemus montrouzieri TaxID=559131 RepID=A0ABD2MYE8_9CUCU